MPKWYQVVAVPTQDEFNWSETFLSLYGKFGSNDNDQDILNFIKSHCVPRQEYEKAHNYAKTMEEIGMSAEAKLAAAEKKLEESKRNMRCRHKWILANHYVTCDGFSVYVLFCENCAEFKIKKEKI